MPSKNNKKKQPIHSERKEVTQKDLPAFFTIKHLVKFIGEKKYPNFYHRVWQSVRGMSDMLTPQMLDDIEQAEEAHHKAFKEYITKERAAISDAEAA